MEKEIILEVIRILIENNFDWSRYNPDGEYINICFTFKDRDTCEFINRVLKSAKVIKIRGDL